MSEAPQSFKDLCLEDPSLVYKSQALLVQWPAQNQSRLISKFSDVHCLCGLGRDKQG